MTRRPLSMRWPVGAIAPTGMLIASAALALPTLEQPLLEAHGFRQTFTAYPALIFHEMGIDLLHPQVPVFGPPWDVPFEFPLFQAAGAMLMNLGLAPDVAMRATGLACFLLTGWLLYRLALRLAGSLTATVALGAFLFSPFGILWGRTSMIEYLATAGGLGFLLAGMAWRDGRRSGFWLAMLAGSIATLVKVTSGGVFLLPLLVYRGAWRDWRSYGLIGVPVALSIAWTEYADAVKASSEATAWLTTAATREWFFGYITDRFDPASWAPILRTMMLDLTGLALFAWVPLSVLAARQLEHQRFAMAFLAASLVPVLVVMPVYAGHSYYLAAISPMIALAVGLSVAWLWERRARVALTALAGGWAVAAVLVADHWLRIYQPVIDPSATLAAAAFVAQHSDPGDTVAISGRTWDPAVWYYARRRGVALDTPGAPRDFSSYTVFTCPYLEPCRPGAAR